MDKENLATLPQVNKADLENAKNRRDAWDFLFVFTDKYLAMAVGENQELMKDFTPSQHTLLAYNYLYGEICNGDFIQLIQNGYSRYVFDNPFSDHLREWGAEKIAEIVDKAKVVYETHREIFDKTTFEDFWELYDKITDFEPLENQFDKVMGKETKLIKKYVENHLEEFAVIE
jgi:hypothetical protein